jgi:O-methyltransferase
VTPETEYQATSSTSEVAAPPRAASPLLPQAIPTLRPAVIWGGSVLGAVTQLKLLMKRAIKASLFMTPAYRRFLPVMRFDMTVAQWHFLVCELSRVCDVPGCVLEIGVGGGSTSVILNQFMNQRGIDKKFVAIDTFSGFMSTDIAVEVSKRGKAASMYEEGYKTQTRGWYLKTLAAHGFDKIEAHKSSIQNFDLKRVTPVAFCLFDVDLYAPTKDALPQIYDALAPGGVVIIDDCAPSVSIFDGAGQAFREFCSEREIRLEVVESKLGVIRKPI